MDLTWIFEILQSPWMLLALPIIGYYCWQNVYDYNDLVDCIAAMGANDATIFIPYQQNITDDLIIPANITLKIIQGGPLNISTGKIVTINGHVDAGLYQIFEGAGSVTFGVGSVKEIYPQWWGAIAGGGAAINTPALQAAFGAMIDNSTIRIPDGLYDFDDVLLMDVNDARIICDGTLKWVGGAGNAIQLGGSVTENYRLHGNIRLFNSDVSDGGVPDWSIANTGIYIVNLYDSNFVISRTTGFQTGVRLYGNGHMTAYNQFHLGEIMDNRVGLFLDTSTDPVNENVFYGGRFQQEAGHSSYAGTRHVNIPTNGAEAGNNNRFYSPSFEKVGNTEIFYYSDGSYNGLYHPRCEGIPTIAKVFLAENGVNQIVKEGLGMAMPDHWTRHFVDLGASNSIWADSALKLWGHKQIYANQLPTGNGDVYHVGDICWHADPGGGEAPGWTCVTEGVAGVLNGGATTGSINNGEDQLTVNSSVDMWAGQYITIAGVTGIKRILAFDFTTLVATIDVVADATVADAAVAYSVCAWKAMANLAA